MTVEAPPQNMQALALANERRLAGAQVRREVKAGTLSISDALADERAQSLTVTRLLSARRLWGRDRTRRALQRVMVPELKRVSDLTERQRRVIAEVVAEFDAPIVRPLVSDEALDLLAWMVRTDADGRHRRASVDLARETGRAPLTVARWLGVLRTHGLVESAGQKPVRWWPTGAGRALAQGYRR